MMGQQVAQGALFYEFRLDDHVPADHLLKRINGLLDFGFVREALASSYSSTGRPSVDPELMLRMLLVGYLFGIRSDTFHFSILVGTGLAALERQITYAPFVQARLVGNHAPQCRSFSCE